MLEKLKGKCETCIFWLQVLLALFLRPNKNRQLRRTWNLAHWTLGRLALALAIANIFIGLTLSSVAYSHIIAQAVVLGGLFIIVVLKNDIEYLLVRVTPAEEERLLKDTYSSSGAASPCVFAILHACMHVLCVMSILDACVHVRYQPCMCVMAIQPACM